MRFLLNITMPIEKANAKMKDGSFPKDIEAILGDLKPEAVYFIEDHGTRTGIIVVNIDDPSEIPAIAEPWFLAFNANVRFHPAMTPDDLMKAGPAIEAAAKRFG